MDFFPTLELSFTSGWLLLIWLYITQPIVLLVVPKDVRTRLLDRSTFTRSQWILTGISKFLVIIVQFIILLTPLKLGSLEFVLGTFLFIFGIIGEVSAVFSFTKTPLNEPVTRGLYKISRNPQETMLTVALFGACIAVGSWFLVLIFGLSRIFNHFQIIAQEQACLQEYGKSYQNYMEKVPRYFLFF
jgi:protein-S-isoprenylcysteine O-methyltransferase Ste14